MNDSNSLPIETVRTSFTRCCAKDDFIDTFYHQLAFAAPQTGPMFANTDMEKQDALVRSGIEHLIEFAAGQDGVIGRIRELGVIHDRQNLDIPPELYPFWIDAMVLAVRECDDQFDEDLGKAWRAVLQPGIDLMTLIY